MRFPSESMVAPRWFSTLSGTSAAGAMAGEIGTAGGVVWTANLAVYVPFLVPAPFVVRRLVVAEAPVATVENWDLGVFTADGEKIVSTGSTAHVNTTTTYVTVAEKLLMPGRYYFGYSNDSTGQVFNATAVVLEHLKIGGVFEEASAFPLPARATFAVLTHALYPIVGMTSTP